MKLVNRETFLRLPAGTVFCKFPLNDKGDAHGMMFGISAPSIKGNTICGNDFYSMAIGEGMSPKGEVDFFDTLFSMQENIGKEYPFELFGERDGMFDDENVGFMVFSREEVEDMINELQAALRIAY